MRDSDPIALPHPGRVRIDAVRTAPCIIEKETKASYWVRWTENIRHTRIRAGETLPIPKRHVVFDQGEADA